MTEPQPRGILQATENEIVLNGDPNVENNNLLRTECESPVPNDTDYSGNNTRENIALTDLEQDSDIGHDIQLKSSYLLISTEHEILIPTVPSFTLSEVVESPMEDDEPNQQFVLAETSNHSTDKTTSSNVDAILDDITNAIQIANVTIWNLQQTTFMKSTTASNGSTEPNENLPIVANPHNTNDNNNGVSLFETLSNHESTSSGSSSTSGYSTVSDSMKVMRDQMFDEVDKIMQEVDDLDNNSTTVRTVDDSSNSYHSLLPRDYFNNWFRGTNGGDDDDTNSIIIRTTTSNSNPPRPTTIITTSSETNQIDRTNDVDNNTVTTCSEDNYSISTNTHYYDKHHNNYVTNDTTTNHRSQNRVITSTDEIDIIVHEMLLMDDNIEIDILQHRLQNHNNNNIETDNDDETIQDHEVGVNQTKYCTNKNYQRKNNYLRGMKQKLVPLAGPVINGIDRYKRLIQDQRYCLCCWNTEWNNKMKQLCCPNKMKYNRKVLGYVIILIICIIIVVTTTVCRNHRNDADGAQHITNTYHNDNTNNAVIYKPDDYADHHQKIHKPKKPKINETTSQQISNAPIFIIPLTNSSNSSSSNISILLNSTNNYIQPPKNISVFELAIWYVVMDLLPDPSHLLNESSYHYESFQFLIQKDSNDKYQKVIQYIVDDHKRDNNNNNDESNISLFDRIVRDEPIRTKIEQRYAIKLFDLVMNQPRPQQNNDVDETNSSSSHVTIVDPNLDECDWYGISCLPKPTDKGRVIHKIRWNNIHLHGTIPLEIGVLSDSLASLDLADNALEGTIPYTMYTNYKLKYLSLRSNQLSGTISTDIGLLRELRELDLRNNYLTGQIPQQLQDLTSSSDRLAYIYLQNNSFIHT